jgi:hypothetical protein
MLILNWSATPNSVARLFLPNAGLAHLLSSHGCPSATSSGQLPDSCSRPTMQQSDNAAVRLAGQVVPANQLCWQQSRQQLAIANLNISLIRYPPTHATTKFLKMSLLLQEGQRSEIQVVALRSLLVAVPRCDASS